MRVSARELSPSDAQTCRDVFLALLRRSPAADVTDARIAQLVIERLLITGAMGFATAAMPSFSEPAVRALFEDSRNIFKVDAIRSNHLCLVRTAEVSALLQSGEVPHAFVKGPLRQKQVYGDAFQRPSSDTDVLVRSKDFERAISTLERCRYLPAVSGRIAAWTKFFEGQIHLIDEQSQRWSIDLHKRLTPPQTETPSDHDAMVDHATWVMHRDTPLPVPQLHDAAVVSALNVVKSLHRRKAQSKRLGGWRRTSINHACELYVQFRTADAAEIRAFLTTAEERGVLSSARLALRVVCAVFEHEFPGLDPDARPILPHVSDTDLINMLIEPSLVRTWPAPHELIWELCRDAPIRLTQHLTRYGASVIARRLIGVE